MVCCQRSNLSTIVMDVVLEVLNSEAVDMLEPADLVRIEGATGAIGGPMKEVVHPGSQPLNVWRAEDGTATGFQDSEYLGEVILMVLDVLGHFDGNGAVDALIRKRDGFIEITTVIGDVFDLEIELRKIAGG